MDGQIHLRRGEQKPVNKTFGIIFDMDNTLLQSNIDYAAMKLDTYQFLTDARILTTGLDLRTQTTSTIIETALQTGRMSDEQINEMWAIAKRHELKGMQDAELEPGVRELLEVLHGKYILTIVTNNSYAAAKSALARNHIFEYFACVIGREQAGVLKPSPAGILRILERYPEIPASNWICVGDSWIDGKASQDAGIPFILYQGNMELLKQHEVHILARIHDIRDILEFVS
jgi:phosphoglycolate phosphatase